ncbi:hypothetical protein LACWKB10_0798 [Lactobacillus sp. wkB10]|nr:hypothetical protein LACWKB10_0798 [Lactobacillus sp. wkB10]
MGIIALFMALVALPFVLAEIDLLKLGFLKPILIITYSSP